MRVIIIGASGYIGSILSRGLGPTFSILEINGPNTRSGLSVDFTSLPQVDEFKKLVEPIDVIINCIGFKDINRSELEPDLAYRINVLTVKNLLSIFSEHCNIIHLSTDFVFGGSSGKYKESDKCNPLTVYGKTKLSAEALIRESAAEGAIVRICAPFDNQAAFPKFITESISKNRVIDCYQDAYYSPLSVLHFVKMMGNLILSLEGALKTLHFSGERISRYHFAKLYSESLVGNSELISPINREKTNLLPMSDISIDNHYTLQFLKYALPPIKKQIEREVRFEI
ncbi:sugar nucleotide-binding protein [Psychromonas sp. SA13A]|uniref:SDR family oxidoreductase n=1 Tax=Psychromonas sp. SA13A TaxID=2686346 RepID=UPI001407784A|nr:sugar nucleotide-binding protein [Psychromonas sp. SA13A]